MSGNGKETGPTAQDRAAALIWLVFGWLVGWAIYNAYEDPPSLISDAAATALVVLFVVSLGLDRVYEIFKPHEGQRSFFTLGMNLVSDTKAGRDMLYLGVTSGLGAIAAGAIGIFILGALGVEGVAPQYEVLLTGLILGGGSALMQKVLDAVSGGD